MEEKQRVRRGGTFGLDPFGVFILLVVAAVALGTVGMLFMSRRGEPEVKRHVAELLLLRQGAERVLENPAVQDPRELSLQDLGPLEGISLETAKHSLGILSDDQGIRVFVGIKIFSDPGVVFFQKMAPEEIGAPLFWGGELGGQPGKNGELLTETLYDLGASPRETGPQWVYLSAGEFSGASGTGADEVSPTPPEEM